MVLLSTLFCFPFSVAAFDFEVTSKNAILYNLNDNMILYEKNSQERISIASMTKIMTAIIALEHIDNLNEKVTLVADDFIGLEEADASVAGFQIGEVVTYLDLLYGLLLPSGADAALALTRNVAGNRESFVALMNAKAEQLGMKNTKFQNETGLDQENQYSTVEDVAKMFQYALQNKIFETIIKTSKYTTSDKLLLLKSTSFKYIDQYGLKMDYFLGGKTGTTSKAGLCLASIASYDGIAYMLVTAGVPYPSEEPYHFYDAKNIYEYYMDHFKNFDIVTKKEKLLTLNTLYAKEKQITISAEETIKRYLPSNFKKSKLQYEYDGMQQVPFNTKVGTKLGTLSIRYQNEVLTTLDIMLKDKLTFSLSDYLLKHKAMIGLITLVLIVFIFIVVF